jgi:hypothetical protein
MNRITSTSLTTLAVILAAPVLRGGGNISRDMVFKSAASQTTRVEAPLVNADVIKLFKMGLGDEIVIAKINQAKVVDFQLDTDDLAKLMEQHVSKSIIAAMFKRATPQAGVASGQSVNVSKIQEPEFMWTFYLLDSNTGSLSPLERQKPEHIKKSVKIEGLGGGQELIQLKGMRSPLKFKEGQQLEFIVMVPSQNADPQEIIQFYSLESDKNKDIRRLIGRKSSFGMFSDKSKSLLGESEIAFNASKYGATSLKISPDEGLIPGEYAFTGPSVRDAFCFSVDPSPANQESRLARTVPFRTKEVIPLGITARVITIGSVEVTAWPTPEALKKAEGLPGDMTSLTVKFTYANQGNSDWKCTYRVTVLDDKGVEIGSGEREAGLNKAEKSDTNRVSVKMRTLDFPRAAKLRVSVALVRKEADL